MGIRMSFSLPVSVNKMYTRSSTGIILSNEARIWKRIAAIEAAIQWGFEPPLKGDIRVEYHFIGSRLDIDNGIKICNDALIGIAYIDDKQITQIHAYRTRKDINPRLEVEISEIGDKIV